MREIKFKAFWDDTSFVGWSEPFTLTDIKNGQVLVDADRAGSDYEDLSLAKVIVQFTGLKDKNGVEIDDGDIYLAEWDGAQPLEVYWDEYLGGFVDGSGDHVGEKAKVAEVIGNIWDNPELLK